VRRGEDAHQLGYEREEMAEEMKKAEVGG